MAIFAQNVECLPPLTILVVLILGGVGVFALLSQRAKDNATTASTTSVPHGTLLYAADWSSGLNGWTGTSDWEVRNGMLHDNGTDSTADSPTIVAPYQVEGITDYAVEVRIQAVTGPNGFNVTTIRASASASGWHGYKVSVGATTVQISAGSITGLSFDVLAKTAFNPGNDWHIYRFEAKGTRLSLLVDGKLVLQL